MIKLSEGELLDLLPSQLKNDTDMICLSYALKMAVDSLLEYELKTMTQNFVELLPERILDVMAVELRSPYYRQDMDIGVKRGIIKNTLIWHAKAGTASAVSEMIEVLFGEGKVVEWYDFDEGENVPGMFDVVTNARMTEDIVEFFLQVVERVKNERSHLRRVLIERDVFVEPRVGSGAIFTPETRVTNNAADREERSLQTERVGSGAISHPKTVITNNGAGKGSSTIAAVMAAGSISFPRIAISNCPRKYANSFIAQSERASAGAALYPKIVITNGTEIDDEHIGLHENFGTGTVSNPSLIVVNGKTRQEESVSVHSFVGAGSASSSRLTITNHPRDETGEGKAEMSAALGAASYPRTIIKNRR